MTTNAYTVSDIATRLEAEVVGDSSIIISGFAPAELAQTGDLTFAENDSYLARAEKSKASAILVNCGLSSSAKTLIRVKNPRVAVAKILPLFHPGPSFTPGIHPTALIAASASIDKRAHIGPFCVIGHRSRIGADVVLRGNVNIGEDCSIGEGSHLHPYVVVYSKTVIGCRVSIHSGTVIGSDGFGYVFDEGCHLKIPQVGNVIIHDDVEIGSNASIDRGALGPTVIGKGSKIDNLVQIGHNVIVGEHCILCGQVGLAGSTRIGDFTTLAGQVGVAGHLKIGNRVTIGAQAGVMNDIPDGEKWLGAPAQPDRETKRMFVAMQRLPELSRRVAELERRLHELQPTSRNENPLKRKAAPP